LFFFVLQCIHRPGGWRRATLFVALPEIDNREEVGVLKGPSLHNDMLWELDKQTAGCSLSIAEGQPAHNMHYVKG
jgi:hypothetical protein